MTHNQTFTFVAFVAFVVIVGMMPAYPFPYAPDVAIVAGAVALIGTAVEMRRDWVRITRAIARDESRRALYARMAVAGMYGAAVRPTPVPRAPDARTCRACGARSDRRFNGYCPDCYDR